MTLKPLTNNHPWNLTPAEAVTLQRHLAGSVVRRSTIDIKDVATVAGVDAHYHRGLASAAVVVIRLCDLTTVEQATAVEKTDFPYIPGLLAFREGPAILAALGRLSAAPDLLIFDGQGIAHPQRCGLASHIGLLLDMPAIGCAKTGLWGRHEKPHIPKGSFSYLTDGDDVIGAVVRTRSEVKPLFVSIGHRISLRDSIAIVLQCCSRYRLPETTRRADTLARSGLKVST